MTELALNQDAALIIADAITALAKTIAAGLVFHGACVVWRGRR